MMPATSKRPDAQSSTAQTSSMNSILLQLNEQAPLLTNFRYSFTDLKRMEAFVGPLGQGFEPSGRLGENTQSTHWSG